MTVKIQRPCCYYVHHKDENRLNALVDNEAEAEKQERRHE